MFWPNFLLLLFLVVVVLLLVVVVAVLGCCCCSSRLLFVGACWCLLVPVGACWCLLVPVGACWCVCGGCVQHFWACPPDPPPPDRPSPGPPKISLFFSLSRPHFRSFSLLGSSRGILVVFLKAWTLKCARLGSLVVVWNPGGPTRPGRRGSHTTARELQTCTFQGSCAPNTTTIPRENPQREKKE